jgi:D-alanyl-D-alanine dipeptidase
MIKTYKNRGVILPLIALLAVVGVLFLGAIVFAVAGQGGIDTGGGGGGGGPQASGATALPIKESDIKGYNSSLHTCSISRPSGCNVEGHRIILGSLGSYSTNIPHVASSGEGVDLVYGNALAGSPYEVIIYAPFSGQVKFSSTETGLGAYGGFIIIQSADGNMATTLAHIVDYPSQGSTVQVGQQVGKLKKYTGSVGPHLHFELWSNDKAINAGGPGSGVTGQKIWQAQKNFLLSGQGAGGGLYHPQTQELVKINSISNIVVDLRYATTNNVFQRKLYNGTTAYLRPQAAQALQKAAEEAQKKGFQLKIWDAYRPSSVQDAMRQIALGSPRPPALQGITAANINQYIAPAGQSKHNKGIAVDITLVKNGSEVTMGSDFDDFSSKAHYNSSNTNEKTLRVIMQSAGFSSYDTEWWHFNYNIPGAVALDVPI